MASASLPELPRGVQLAGWLSQHTLQRLRAPRPRSPALRVVELGGQPVVVKDFLANPAWYRHTVGRLSLAHEAAAYRRLAGCPGVPRLVASTPEMLAIEYIQGVALEDVPAGGLPPVALEQLRRTLQEMHRRGVAHADIGHDFNGDLGRETNLIWSRTGRLYVIDLGSSIRWGGWLLGAMMAHDRLALTKLVLGFLPQLEDAEALELPLLVPPLYWRLWRLLGKV